MGSYFPSTNCTVDTSSAPAGMIFMQLLQSLLSAQCALADNSVYPRDRASEILADPIFDFIVVGAGTAGSVVASRLSEINDWRVLLIERGKDSSLISKIPKLYNALSGTAEDYAYQTEPDSRFCQGMSGKRCYISRGKGVGGSSLINGMLHVRGNRRDYDSWSSMGNYGWSYDEILSYFRKSENYHPEIPSKFGPKYFGVGGPVNIRSFNFSYFIMDDIMTEAGKEMGYDQVKIFNRKDFVGFGKMHCAADRGIRQDVARAFLSPAKNRKNLFVIKSTRADSVVIVDGRAVGVKVTLENGRKVKLRARKEVVLSAGCFVTPQLLMLSGIGPSQHLKTFGIKVLSDLPVGDNLKDHVGMFNINFSYSNDSKASSTSDSTLDQFYEFLSHRSGPFASNNGNDFTGFVNVNDPNSEFPNVQYAFTFVRKGTVHAEAPQFGISSEIAAQLNEISKNSHVISAVALVLNPKSSGKIRLRSRQPEDQVKIHPNYYDDEEDVEVMLKGIEFIVNMTSTRAFKKHDVKLRLLDLKACKDTKKGSGDYWKCRMRQGMSTTFHQVGTAKMGPVEDPTTVVDPELRVHGIKGLRVIDASVMPKIMSANPHATVMMIAEKGSDIVKDYWLRTK